MSSKKPKIRIKKGDVVLAISGAEAGKKGKVLFVDPARNRALVEGVNLFKKHMRKTQDNPKGGIIERETPIQISNLKVFKGSN